MEYDQNTNDINNKDSKSDNNSKDLSANLISSNSAIQLTKDLKMRRGKLSCETKTFLIR